MARSVAEMLNAQPIGGKKGTRWRDDIWTMKYLPRFKWNMLTEQVGMLFGFYYYNWLILLTAYFAAHEAAVHAAKLRVELSQSKTEQQDYLKNVELARVLDKRVAKKREKGEEFELKTRKRPNDVEEDGRMKKKVNLDVSDSILSSIF